jgi:hypothetical protein
MDMCMRERETTISHAHHPLETGNEGMPEPWKRPKSQPGSGFAFVFLPLTFLFFRSTLFHIVFFNPGGSAGLRKGHLQKEP